MRVSSVGFKSMMTRQGKSLFFPTLHPAAGLAPGKSKYSLFSWDLLKELAFLRGREAIHIRCKRRSKLWPWHAEPPFTNTPEVRIHLRTCFWCWSLASTITSLLCVPPTGASGWSLALLTTNSLDTRCIIRSYALVMSSTTTERLGNLHPQDWESTLPFHTYGDCVVYILYFQLFLYVEG